MTTHRFTLQPYKTPADRHTCPQCGHKRTFTRYIDIQTNTYLGDAVGCCNRADKCGYHFKPKQHFANHPEAGVTHQYQPVDPVVSFPLIGPSVMAMDDVSRSLNNYHQNNLITWLASRIGANAAMLLAEHYRIGTSDHWPGATVFWQIDEQNKTRTGKIMLYNAQTGKRVKKPYNHIYWMHRKMFTGYYLSQCLFGLHLLPHYPDKPIAIVESEKTALIAAHYMPQYLWLATGGLNNLNADKCQVLKGRKVLLWPDVNALAAWQQKALDLELLLPGTRFNVCNTLEQNATDEQRLNGWDVGDWLV